LQVICDIPKSERPKKKPVLTLIHKQDSLTNLLYQFVEAGYSPSVNFESGRITALKLELSGMCCTVQAKQLMKSAIGGVVAVDTEEIRNSMNQAMCTFSCKLFLKSHLSHHTAKDLEVLDSYRTQSICGNMRKHPSNNVVD
jgi:hypothetical protein